MNFERHKLGAAHGGMIHTGGAFLLEGGIGVAFESGVGVAGHVPGMGDAGGCGGVQPR